MLGVVDRFDELPEQVDQVLGGPGLLATHRRAKQLDPALVQAAFEPSGSKAFVGDQLRAGPVSDQAGSTSSIAASTWRSSSLGLASVQVMGVSAEIPIICSRSPQNQREWEGQ